MGQLKERTLNLLSNKKKQLIVFSVCVLATLGALLAPHTSFGNAPTIDIPSQPYKFFTPNISQVSIKTKLSQTKVVQGNSGQVYLSVALTTPDIETPQKQNQPLDLILVLDTSGSMQAQNKLGLAKQAIKQIVQGLSKQDRLGLVTFSTHASILSPLAYNSASQRQALIHQIDAIYSSGSTNISDALYRAKSMMDRQSGRRQKVILLSDGNANNGITHTTGLSDIAKGFNPQNIILSTVGMGLDFNENVLASLADNGMGAYSYLEHLAGLETILTAELHDLRSVFAPSSRLQISTSSNTRLVDAGGYPVERSGDYITIPTGQLLYNSTKNLVLSFDVPTHSVGSMELGQLTLKFERDGETTSIQNEQAPITVAVVEPSLIDDALATINKSVLQDAWQFNNLGMMERAVSQAVRKGDKSQAIQELKRFETQVAQAEETYGIDLNDEKLRSNIYSLRQKVDGAFAGPPAIAAEEQNRVAKEIHQSGRSNQIKLQRR